MDADDINEIEEIFQRNIDVMSETFDRKTGDMSERFEQTVKHQMGELSEDFQYNLDIVVEGHQMLSEKMDRVEANLSRQIGSVSAELSGTGPTPRRITGCTG